MMDFTIFSDRVMCFSTVFMEIFILSAISWLVKFSSRLFKNISREFSGIAIMARWIRSCSSWASRKVDSSRLMESFTSSSGRVFILVTYKIKAFVTGRLEKVCFDRKIRSNFFRMFPQIDENVHNFFFDLLLVIPISMHKLAQASEIGFKEISQNLLIVFFYGKITILHSLFISGNDSLSIVLLERYLFCLD